jgi:hypothetical protein
MNHPPRLGGRKVQVLRSQLALEVALTAYALVGAALIVRLALRLLDVPARVWAGGSVYGVTDPLLWPLQRLPGGERELLGAATLSDVTAVAIVALIPMALVARDRSR